MRSRCTAICGAKEYDPELARLHGELVKLQLWAVAKGLKVVVVFDWRTADIGVSPLVQGFHEKDAALRRVLPIFRGRVEQRGTLRHQIFLVDPTVGSLGASS